MMNLRRAPRLRAGLKAVVARAPTTSADVAGAIGSTVGAARLILLRLREAGLVETTGRRAAPTRGRRRYVYRATVAGRIAAGLPEARRLRAVALALCLVFAPAAARADLVETTATATTGLAVPRIHLPPSVCPKTDACAQRAILDSVRLLGRLRECRVDLAAARGAAAAGDQTRAKLVVPIVVRTSTPAASLSSGPSWGALLGAIGGALAAGMVAGVWAAKR